ncbi:MAG: hypothetical protein U0841_30475 [Chloroflexia bacterium]
MLPRSTALGQPEAALAVYQEAVALGEREAAYADLSMIHRAAQATLIIPYYADRVAWRDECAAAGREQAAAAAARVGFRTPAAARLVVAALPRWALGRHRRVCRHRPAEHG